MTKISNNLWLLFTIHLIFLNYGMFIKICGPRVITDRPFLIILVSTAVSNSEADLKGPVFVKEPENRIDFSNSTGAVVECRATAHPTAEIIWITYRSDNAKGSKMQAVGDVPGLRQVLPNGNLVFPPFRAEDYRQEVHAQVYACLAKNSIGTIISRDVHVRAGELTFSIHQEKLGIFDKK
jgi:hypothetical protein